MAWQTLDQQYREQNNQNDRSNYLKDIIAGLSIANNNDPMTLLGYALGKWGSNYINRGLERRQQEKNTKGYDEWMQGVNKAAADAIPTAQGKAIPAKQELDMLQGTPFVAQDLAKEITAGRPDYRQTVDMPNTDWLNAGQQQNAPFFSPSISSQAKDIANQVLGGQRQYAQNYDMTSEEVYNNAYRIARQNGSTETQARQFARQKAEEYQPQRVNALSDAFINAGVNPDGTINNQGVAMLAQMAQERPEMVNMLGNMYQSPQGATKYAQEIAKMMQNSNLHLQNAKEMAGVNFDYQQRGADAQMQRNQQMAELRARFAAQAAMDSAYGDAIRQGATPEQAQQIAAEQGRIAYNSVLGGYSAGGRGGNGGNGNRNGGGRNGGNSGDNGQMKPSDLKTMQEFINGKIEEAENGMMAFGEDTNNPDYQRLKTTRDYWRKRSDRLGREDPVLSPSDLNGATKILLDNGNSWDDIFTFFKVAKQQRDGSENPLTAGEVMNAVRKNGGNEEEAAKLIAALDIQDMNAGENVGPIENNPVQQEGNRLTDEELRKRANR